MRKLLSIIIITCLFIPQITKAQSNYETNFNITIDEFPYMEFGYGSSDNSYKDFIDELKNYQTNTYFYITFSNSYNNYNSRPDSIKIVITNTIPNYDNSIIYYWNQRYNGTLFIPKYNSVSNFKYKEITYSNFNYNDNLQEIKNCLDNYSSCNWTSITEGINGSFGGNILNNIGDSDYSFNITSNIKDYPMYSNFDLILGTPTTAQLNESSMIFKNVIINNNIITTKMLTYYDLYYPNTPEPEPEPDEPVDPDEPTSDFTSWIYWFSEPTDSISVLNNIYTLLFLYCFTIIILKVYSIFKIKK